jgi:hypothetical protein
MPSSRRAVVRCEVAIDEAGFEGSWYAGSKVRGPRHAGDRQTFLIRFDELDASDESDERLAEWVFSECIRPAPPEPPADWRTGLSPGARLDLFYEGGWWGVALLRVGCAAASCDVLFRSRDGAVEKTHEGVPLARLRPSWVWEGNQWSVSPPDEPPSPTSLSTPIKSAPDCLTPVSTPVPHAPKAQRSRKATSASTTPANRTGLHTTKAEPSTTARAAVGKRPRAGENGQTDQKGRTQKACVSPAHRAPVL